jgi:hypothetical protein
MEVSLFIISKFPYPITPVQLHLVQKAKHQLMELGVIREGTVNKVAGSDRLHWLEPPGHTIRNEVTPNYCAIALGRLIHFVVQRSYTLLEAILHGHVDVLVAEHHQCGILALVELAGLQVGVFSPSLGRL